VLILERYLSREVLRPMIGLTVFLLTVVLIFYASRFLGRAATDGLPMELVGLMVALRLGLFLDVLIPCALLLGMLIGLGRLQSAHETTAVISSGVSPARFFRLLGCYVVLVAAVVLALAGWFRPWAYQTLYQLDAELAADLTIDRIEPGRFQVGGRHWLIHAEGRDDQGLTEVMIHYRNDGDRGLSDEGDTRSLLTAQRMQQRVDEAGLVRLQLSDQVRSYSLDQARAHDMVASFDQLELIMQPLPLIEREQLRRARPSMALWGHAGAMEIAELQWRLVAPVTVMVFAFAALTLGRRPPRSQSSWPIFAGLLVATGYFSVLGVFINAVEQGRLSPWPGAFWTPAALLVVMMMLRWIRLQRGVS
jgi:lipopolysaccharide export system permease protein